MREGWNYKYLKELSSIIYGHTDKASNEIEGPKYLRITDIQENAVDWNNVPQCKPLGKDFERYRLHIGDIVFARTGATTGKSFLIREDINAVFASYLIRVQINKSELNEEYLYYYFQSPDYWDIISEGISGSAQGGFNAKKLGALVIPIPPLQEQKQIVAILDEAFETIDQAKANTEKNIQNAKELFQSKLNEIFSQKGDGWEQDQLINLTTKIGSGSTPRGGQASYKKEGISLIRSMNVHDNGFKKKKLAFIDDEQAKKLDNVSIEEGDVLLNITGASVARCCTVPKKYLPARVNQHVSIIRPIKDKLDSDFLHYILTSKVTKDKLLGIGEQGATRQAITKAQLETFIISYPTSIDAQRKTMKELNAVREKTESIAFSYQEKINRLDELKKSILQKAFAGELTSTVSDSSFTDKTESLSSHLFEKIDGISPTDLQAGLTAIALNKHLESETANTFHHVKAEKIIHLAEYALGIDLERNPVKDAAGPNDFKHSKKIESRAKKAGFYTVSKHGDVYEYSLGTQAQKLIDKATNTLGNRFFEFNKLLELFVPMNTQQAEIVATVYAAWNNLLIQGQPTTDEAIVLEARENWHKNKLKIERNKFFNAIEWMKKYEILIPKGNGKMVTAK
jgi:type I restriction enzyme S subunit